MAFFVDKLGAHVIWIALWDLILVLVEPVSFAVDFLAFELVFQQVVKLFFFSAVKLAY